jgi:hypothetical protein
MTTCGLRAVCFLALLSIAGRSAPAQLIQIKTIPIAQGDQFQIFPSHTFGMASVSIALSDSLHDPFLNPATAARIRVARFFSTPTIYNVSRGAGGGRSLPVAVLARATTWYAGLSLALQQVDPSRTPNSGGRIVTNSPPPPPPFGVAPLDTGRALPLDPDLRAHGNRYVFGMIGRAFDRRNLSLAGSALWTDIHAIDGVDLLYAGSRRVAQSGHTLDLRLGALKEWPGARGARSLEAVVLHNRFAATHDVIYADQFWDPGTQQVRERARAERNFDRSVTWGMHLDYAVPLAAPGWRMGWLATVNRSSHPKIPNYELPNVPVIPRDPGYSSAYNVGIGLSKVRGAATFGMDLIYEPIWSHTWADAAAPVVTALGDTIAAGDKTVENRFHFSNALLRVGAGRDIELRELGKAVGVQVGLLLRWTHYWLDQTDHVQLTQRALEMSWLEWTPTWGFSLRFPELELRYRGSVTHGTGRPGFPFGVGILDVALASGTILAAPNGPVNFTDVNTTTHQISLSLPLH